MQPAGLCGLQLRLSFPVLIACLNCGLFFLIMLPMEGQEVLYLVKALLILRLLFIVLQVREGLGLLCISVDVAQLLQRK